MFTRADADALRASLKPIQFQGEPMTGPLLEKYCSHYGLVFSSNSLSVSHHIGSFEIPGPQGSTITVVCHHFALPLQEQRGTAFLLHGYFDHSGLFANLIRHCLEQGLSVIIFDQPGHGLSSGAIASIDSFKRYVSALEHCLQLAERQEIAKPWYSIGQSTGGAVLMDALLSSELAFTQNVLLAPLVRPLGWTQTRLLFAVTSLFLKSTPRSFSENSHDEEFLTFLRNSDDLQSRVIPRDWVRAMMDYQRRFAKASVNKASLYVIQGTGDGTVDWRYNLDKIQQKFPASKTFMVAEARHHLVNESEKYRGRIFDLISDALQAETAQGI